MTKRTHRRKAHAKAGSTHHRPPRTKNRMSVEEPAEPRSPYETVEGKEDVIIREDMKEKG
jgi:hypothetical protein